MGYTLEQKAFLLESYFRNGEKINDVCTYSLQRCLEEFRTKFPEVFINYEEFKNTGSRRVTLFRETGSIQRKKGSGTPLRRTAEVVAAAKEVMDNEPSTSLRHLSLQINLSVGACHKLLHTDLDRYPYRLTAVQELLPVDYPTRLHFCQWFLNNLHDNEEILQKTFFSDEAWFYKSDYVNSKTMRIWGAENPHTYVQKPLHPEKVGVWAALSGRRIIGPIYFEGTLTAERYILFYICYLGDASTTLYNNGTPHVLCQEINRNLSNE